jgi:uncharacterized membrane protein
MPETGKQKLIGQNMISRICATVFLIYAFVSFSTFMSGCSETDDSTKVNRDSLKAARDSANAKARDMVVRTDFEGLYNYELSGSTFRDCRHPDSVYIVNDASGKLKSQFEKVFPASNVYGSIVVKVKGTLVPTVEQKFKDKYPKTIKITEVIQVDKKNFNNTCVPYDFWAFGNEPNWSLQISKKEGIIDLQDVAGNKNYSFFWNEPKTDSGFIAYSSFNTIRKYSIDIKIRKEKCNDTMSDTEYEYSVTAEITGGKKFKGCAIKGK